MDQVTVRRRGVGVRGINALKASPGYTLLAPLTSPGVVKMIDNDGEEVHRWSVPYRPGRHATIMKNGSLAFNGVHPDAPSLFPLWQKYRGGVMMEIAPDGAVISEHRDPMAHHDQHRMENGHLLYTTIEPLTAQQAATILGGIPNSEALDGKVYGDCIKHVTAHGKLLWSWKAIDHLDPTKISLQPNYSRNHWPLITSVSPMKDGNILASLRSTSAVIIISRETGKVIWHLHSTAYAQLQDSTELDDGSILLFDNGPFRHHESIPYSRVIQVSPKDKSVLWEYRDPNPVAFFAHSMGSAQRLKNGNTLISESEFGRIFEVTPAGETVWEYVNPDFADYASLGVKELEGRHDHPSNALFRAYKYTPEEVPWLHKRYEKDW